METSIIASILKILSDYFTKYSIPYVIVGGISVLTWGRTRTTEDVDIILDHKKLDISDFVKYLEENNFFAKIEDFEGLKEQGHCTAIHKDSLFRVDIIGTYTQDHEISITEAREVDYSGILLRIDSPENLIAHKLKFGAEFDIEDAVAVIVKMNNKLNYESLSKHASRLGVEDKLKELLTSIKNRNNSV